MAGCWDILIRLSGGDMVERSKPEPDIFSGGLQTTGDQTGELLCD